MDVEKYLERIGFAGEPKLDYATLCVLQRAHLMHVPYENLDILAGIPLRLDPQSLYEKIVLRRRGGYCFELNGLFGALLRALGFEVHDHMARFLLNEPSIPMRRHRVLRVVLEEGECLCDVGVGIVSPTEPVRLEYGVHQAIDQEQYRVEQDEFLGDVIHQCYRGKWSPFFAFTREPQLDIDYIMPSFYCEKHPDSPFTSGDMLAIWTPYGGKNSANGPDFTYWDEAGKHQKTITDPAERLEALRRWFGIVL